MPFQPCPGVARTEIRMSWLGKPVEYVLHWLDSGPTPWTAVTIQSLATNVSSHFSDQFMPIMAADTTLQSVYAVDLTAEGSFAFEYFPSVGNVGTMPGPQVPNHTCACVTHRTALSGRSYRGRTYCGGFSENESLGNNITAGYGTSLEAAWAQFVIELEATSALLCVLSRSNGGVPRVNGVGTTVTSTGLRNLRIDTQRRRLPED